jgi:hypothetical protein
VELYKKRDSRFYWYDFKWRGKRYRSSTKETNKKRAGRIAAGRLSQAMGGIGPLDRKAPSLQGFSIRVFASFRLQGKQPRVANMLVEDYLRPAAAKAGILSSHRDEHGRLVEDDPRRFGFHNLRHSLASFLVRIRTDPKTVQTLLRHSDVKLTLQFYSHAVSQDRMAAAGEMLKCDSQPRCGSKRTESGLRKRRSCVSS